MIDPQPTFSFVQPRFYWLTHLILFASFLLVGLLSVCLPIGCFTVWAWFSGLLGW